MISQVLSTDQIEKIHNVSLTILERVGVMVPHEQMLCMFAGAGASVDRVAQRVRIPADLVTRSLASAARQFTIYGRDLTRKAEFGVGKRNYNTIAGEALWIDEVGASRRYANLNDTAVAARFADGLEGINVVGAMADPQEIPVEYRCVAVMATLIRNTIKPITFWFHDRASARFIVEMMIALRGDERRATDFPVAYPLMEPISPLRFPFHGVDLLFETARINLPVQIGPMAQMGVSAPATIAGTLAIENAEILAGICITQLVRPGMPVCYGGICHAFDMRTTQMIFSGPEQAIFGVAMTQMGKHYGLPIYINVGLTDSKRPDAQAGLEAGITLAMGAAAGADIFGHTGIAGVDQAASLDMLVMQDEVIRYVESMMREIDFSDGAMGLDVIESLGPGGSFIDTDHTARNFRRELWFPRLLDRSFYQAWLDGGSTSMEERCRQRKREILQAHKPETVDANLGRQLDNIVEAARKELTAKNH